jgi:hypothetical protein
MAIIPEKPAAEAVEAAGKKFDEENKIIEDALGEHFRQYPRNTSPAHVLLKVTTLNDLYSTQIPRYSERIPTLWEVVYHIVGLGFDSALDLDSSDLVYKIAKTEIPNKGIHCNYSFATKHCSWHKLDSYPIYDSRADEFLWHLRNQGCTDRFDRPQLKVYPRFKEIVTKFRDSFGPARFTFKDIDKFLFLEGGRLFAAKEKEMQTASATESQKGQPEPD